MKCWSVVAKRIKNTLLLQVREYLCKEVSKVEKNKLWSWCSCDGREHDVYGEIEALLFFWLELGWNGSFTRIGTLHTLGSALVELRVQ